MPPHVEIKDRTLHDLNRAIRNTVDHATDDTTIDEEWAKLYGPARDALSLMYWRKLIAEKQASARSTARAS